MNPTHRKFRLHVSNQKNQTKIRNFLEWTQINLEKPPPLRDEISSRARLNELLASITSKCERNKAQSSGNGLSFHPCANQQNHLCLLISGANTFDGFVEFVNCSKWIVVVPFGSDVVERMNGEVEVNYLMEFEDWISWDLSTIEESIKNRNFSATLIDLDGPKRASKLNSTSFSKTFGRIVEMISTQSLFVNIRLPKFGWKVVNEYYDWILENFYERNLALTGASTSGFCHEPSKFCTYALSFQRFHQCLQADVPVFGFGSPIEEKMRFMLSLYQPKPTKDCTLKSTTDGDFLFCGNNNKSTLSIVHIGKNPIQIAELPTFVSRSSKLRNIHSHENFPVGDEIDLVLFDLNSSIWSLLIDFLSKFHKTKQITIKSRLFIEEGENYRHFYAIVRCLRKDFRLVFGEWTQDEEFLSLKAVFQRNK